MKIKSPAHLIFSKGLLLGSEMSSSPCALTQMREKREERERERKFSYLLLIPFMRATHS